MKPTRYVLPSDIRLARARRNFHLAVMGLALAALAGAVALLVKTLES